MRQATKRVAIYCRVSTDDQDNRRQIEDLTEFATNRGFEIIGKPFEEKASGAKTDRAVRAEIIKLARSGKIDAILVTELTRWSRSTQDLIETVQQLATWKVSIIAQTGMEFDMSNPQHELMLTMMAGFSQFERKLIAERVKSGLKSAQARGVKLGRQVGQNPSDKHSKRVLNWFSEGKTIRWIAEELHISTNTVLAIKKRKEAA